MPTPSQYIPEFIQALQEEIDALKKGKGGSVVKIFDGRLLREASGYFIYLFHLENFLMALDDTPAEIEIDGKRSQCQVVSVQGLEVQVALEKDHGQNVAEARLQTSLWFLLESLRKKFEEEKNNPGDRFGLSEKLFAGVSNLIAQQQIPHYAQSTSPPNPSQEKAINVSFSRSLAVIWVRREPARPRPLPKPSRHTSMPGAACCWSPMPIRRWTRRWRTWRNTYPLALSTRRESWSALASAIKPACRKNIPW